LPFNKHGFEIKPNTAWTGKEDLFVVETLTNISRG